MDTDTRVRFAVETAHELFCKKNYRITGMDQNPQGFRDLLGAAAADLKDKTVLVLTQQEREVLKDLAECGMEFIEDSPVEYPVAKKLLERLK